MKTLLLILSAFCSIQAMAYTPMAGHSKPQSGVSKASGPVLYYGGPVLSAVKIYAVFWGAGVNKDTQSGVGAFYGALTNSSYFDLMKQYGTKDQTINRGSFVKTITITPGHTAAKLDQTDVEAELISQFDSGALPAPDANSLYIVHFPPKITITAFGGASCQEWCGDHEAIKHNPKYGNVAYAMIPDMGGACAFGCYGSGSSFTSVTIVTSHEIAEAVTDPVSPGVNEKPAFPAAWLSADLNEIGDLCVGGKSHLKAGATDYLIQNEWDNSQNKCNSGTFQ